MRADPQARGPTLMRDGLEKSVWKFYAGQANPIRSLQTKCETDQSALLPLFVIEVD